MTTRLATTVTRRARTMTIVLALGLLAASVPQAGASASSRHHIRHHRRHRTAPPAHVLVYAQEWSLWPSRSSLPAGAVVVQLWNRGQDAHDLVLKRLSHGRMTGAAQNVAVTQSGGLSQASWRVAPGSYELFCSMPGHMARGMHTILRVR